MAWPQSAVRRGGVRIYRALLFAYPAEFRHEYASEMEQLFAERLASEPRFRVWFDALRDIAVTAPREHIHILTADLRYGARIVAKSPGFTAVALLALALGIGATTAVFSLINAVLIRSLPYEDPQRLLYVWMPIPRLKQLPLEMGPSSPDFYAWQQASHSFRDLTQFDQRRFTLVHPGASRHIGGAAVAGNFFRTLGAKPQIGRTVEAADDQPGHEHVVVISDALWHSLFSAEPGALGKTLQLDRELYTVIGVMPPAFAYPHSTDFPYSDQDVPATELWIPAALTTQQKSDFNANSWGLVIGRLRSGVTLQQAQAELSAIEARIDPVLHPPFLQGCTALLRPLVDTAVGPVRPLMWLLVGAGAFVLLIACSNLANLLLARAAGRVHEMGVRTALGAERARLIRQMLTEAVGLALGGGVLGAGLAYAIVRLVVSVHPGNIPRLDESSLDARVLLFAAGVSLLSGLGFGLLPALAASRVDVTALLKQGGNKGMAGTSNRLRNGLIVTEVALSVILLAAAGLLIRTYVKVLSVDTGFAPSTLSAQLTLDDRYDTPQKIDSFFRTLIGGVSSIPGVKSAGLINALPLSHRESIGTFEISGHPVKPNEMVNHRSATTQYFRTMEIRLLEGRLFTDDAAPGHPSELLVSESFAKSYFPSELAVGQKIRFDSKEPWRTVVGVVADVRHSTLEETPKPMMYDPLFQAPQTPISLTVRSSVPPEQLSSSIRQIVHAIDPAIVPDHITTMHALITEAAGPRRFQTVALTAFAGVAVFLALVGLYGLMAYAVKQRTAEIGLRIALGASPQQVLTMVISKGLALTAVGLVIGLTGALAVTRLGTRWLYEVSPADPVTFLLVPALILLVALGACLIPAWKATRVDPVAALRCE